MNTKLEKIMILSYKRVNKNEIGQYNVLLRACTPQIPKVAKAKPASQHKKYKKF